ncbi:protein ABHD11-like [Uloborus diversus]|uniref:protein ABHD11-like n=1 Tax=Uloborus diversus TaxID=327109 RepID=UPI00240A1452|nr:protein ABHD11-like [Uloborus diversus]
MKEYLFPIGFFLFLFVEIREINGKMNLAYDVYLPSSGEQPGLSPIVFLHGFLDSKKSWKYVAQPLADKTGRTIYTYDARNHGDSPWTSDFNIDILAEDLEDFLALRNISETILVGHSMGGRTAQTLALRQPDKVQILIVEDMSMADLTQLPDAATGLLMRLLRKSLTAIPPNADAETAIEAVKAFFLKAIPESFIPRRAFDASIAPVNIDGGNITWQANLDVLEQSIYAGALGNNFNRII